MIVCYLYNFLYLPKDVVPQKLLDYFTYTVYPRPQACKVCEVRSCTICPYRPKEVKTYYLSSKYVLIPWGNKPKVKKILNKIYGIRNIKFVEKRCFDKLGFDLSWNKEYPLRPEQKLVVKEWLKKKYGIIQAPPRTGKTVMASYIVKELGVKTIILAHKEDLLNQFEETFYRFTNLSEVEKFEGKRLIYSIKEVKNLFKAGLLREAPPILLSTFQIFLKNKELLNFLKTKYGLVIVDECHHTAAPFFKKVVANFASKYRLGLSATPTRKDRLECVAYDILGPVTVVANSCTLGCRVEVIPTGYTPGNFYHWTTFTRRLSRSQSRNKLIVKFAKKDYEEGRSILIVVTLREHANTLVKMLKEAGIEVVEFTGSIHPSLRKPLLEKMRKEEVRCAVATRQIVQEGIDCPRWDTIYFLIPSSNENAIFQEISRIRTPHPGKKSPLIRYFLDNHKAAYACFNVAKKVFKREGFLITNLPLGNTRYGFVVR